MGCLGSGRWYWHGCGGMALGCASPGRPKAPSLEIPQVVTDLSAERVGGGVHLRWTTPGTTTDNLPLPRSVVAVLCRRAAAKSGVRGCLATRFGGCRSSRGLPMWTMCLPASLSSGPAELLGYRVEILNGAGRSAGRSEEVFAAGGAAPGPVERFAGTARRRGVRLEWMAEAGEGWVELERREVAPGVTGAAAQRGGPGGAGRHWRRATCSGGRGRGGRPWRFT